MSVMMNCRQYLFMLTSEQLNEADWLTRFQASQHRMMCRRCKTFTRNDAALSQITEAFRDRLLDPTPPEPALPPSTRPSPQPDEDEGSGKL